MATPSVPPWTGFNFTQTLHNKPSPALNPERQSLPASCVILVTGASRGIGAATAKAFALAGATGLILTARATSLLEKTRKECEEISGSNIKITTVAADAGSEDSAKQIADLVKTEHGRLDVLINNAGIVSTDASAFENRFEDIATSQMEETMRVNYLGRFLMVKYLVPILLASPNGAKAIVNITSFSSHLPTNSPGFSISELATNRLTEAAAEMYKNEGVMVYAVHPGMVITTPPPGMPESVLQFCQDEPGLCGAFCIWLIKEKREWLSGRYVSANWDIEELERRRTEIVTRDMLKFRMVV